MRSAAVLLRWMIEHGVPIGTALIAVEAADAIRRTTFDLAAYRCYPGRHSTIDAVQHRRQHWPTFLMGPSCGHARC